MKTDLDLREKGEDLQLQMAMLRLEQWELEEAEKELADLESQNTFQPTAGEQKRIFAAIDQELNRQKRVKRLKSAWRITQKASVFLLVFLIGLGATVISVEAFREPLIRWLVSVGDTSAHLQFHPEDGSLYLKFGYLPKGYQANLVDADETLCLYTIENTERNTLCVSVGPLTANLNTDVEDAEITELIINGFMAMGINKDDVSILIWATDEHSFSLDGNIDLSELIKIAENLEIMC